MIQFVWILLALNPSVRMLKGQEISTVFNESVSTNHTSLTNAMTDLSDDNSNRIKRTRLLQGETMGGLHGCESFTYGDEKKKEFYSPDYPQEYPASITCIRVLNASSSNYQVVLDFRDMFNIEPSDDCKFDYLEIRDGSYGYSPLLQKYCGHEFPEPIMSSGSTLWLRFHSDENVEYNGFKAVYWFQNRTGNASIFDEEPCFVNLPTTDTAGNVSNMDIEEKLRERANKTGIDCLFNITVAKGKKVSLQWDSFNLQFPNECDLNYVEVFGNDTDTIKNTYCGAAAEPLVSDLDFMYFHFVAKKAAVNSTFVAHYTAFRKAINCSDDEFNCQDGTCIDMSLVCDEVNHCPTASDEDEEECEKRKQKTLWEKLTEKDLLIILIVFFMILFGMCFTLIFNVVRKLVHDFHIIKEHVHQSKESNLDEMGRKTPTATLLTPMATILPKLPENLTTQIEVQPPTIGRTNSFQEPEDCYVPTEHTFPNLIRREYSFEKLEPGEQPRHRHRHFEHSATCPRRQSSRGNYTGDEDEDGLYVAEVEPTPSTKDSECQTRESLFQMGTSSDSATKSSPTPPPAPVRPQATIRRPTVEPIQPPVGFTTFGYRDNRRPDKQPSKFRAEAVIEMERFRSPNKDSSVDSKRPYSLQSTKSAPDVIVTH